MKCTEKLFINYDNAEFLKILNESSKPLSGAEMIQNLKTKFDGEFSKADLKILSGGRPRWEATARFAIYQGLKKKDLIEAKTKNQWTITQKGIDQLKGT
jgi:hypothetical protein